MVDKQINHPVDEAQMLDLVDTAGGIITGLEQITPAVFDAAPNLKVVSAGGVGYDHIDFGAAEKHGVVIANCAGCNNHAVSELAFGMMLNLARKIRLNDAAMRTEGWVSSGDSFATAASSGAKHSVSSDSAASASPAPCSARPSA